MTRIIDNIRDIPPRLMIRQQELKGFFQLFDETLTFAPDRLRVDDFTKPDSKSSSNSFLKHAAAIEKALKKEFFSSLYIKRIQKDDIKGYFPAKRLILFHGLMGTGKTVFLMKAKQELDETGEFRLEYFDWKAIIERFNQISEQEFTNRFRAIVYHALQSKYIDVSETLIKDWLVFRIENDVDYLGLKELILDTAQKPLSKDEWLEFVSKPLFQEKRAELQTSKNLSVLLNFLSEKIPLVLCFDNVDVFSLHQQSKVLEACIHLSNDAQIPIVLSIRTPNIRRINPAGTKGDIVYYVELEPLVHQDNINEIESDDSSLQLAEPLSEASIQRLLEKRIEFVRERKEFLELGIYFKEMLENLDIKLSVDESVQAFWNIFKPITKTFIKGDVYRFCNYNIRAILVFYFNFISGILINPEPAYSAGKLISLKSKKADITLLRTYLYKWLVCGDEILPNIRGSENINIFEFNEDKIPMLTQKILSYLLIHKDQDDGIKGSELLEDLWRIGIDRGLVIDTVYKLSKNQEENEKSFIWLDKSDESPLFEDSRIFLMPAGEYFIDHLCLSREYVFWMALVTDLPSTTDTIKITGSDRFYFEETTNDKFKLNVVYNFIEMILLPSLEKELQRYKEKLYSPDGWDKTNIEYFLITFGLDRSLFHTKLTESILNSIQFTDLSNEDKSAFMSKYASLLKVFRNLEKDVAE